MFCITFDRLLFYRSLLSQPKSEARGLFSLVCCFIFIQQETLDCSPISVKTSPSFQTDGLERQSMFPSIAQSLTKLALWFLHLLWLPILEFNTYLYSNSTWSFLEEWLHVDFNDLKVSCQRYFLKSLWFFCKNLVIFFPGPLVYKGQKKKKKKLWNWSQMMWICAIFLTYL